MKSLHISLVLKKNYSWCKVHVKWVIVDLNFDNLEKGTHNESCLGKGDEEFGNEPLVK
jgi:hypothetical protein